MEGRTEAALHQFHRENRRGDQLDRPSARQYVPRAMPSGAPLTFALLRVPRGQAHPSEEQFRTALSQDRERLHQPPPAVRPDVTIAGPYAIIVDGAELDEYVAWER